MKHRIVLTMIVKNEEHVIERALNSCYKMIDSYCIVDTGSTDKTKEVIKNFFDSKGIEGKIVDFEFTNYEECRNKSIEFGKELGEYGFWMDADEELILDKTFSKQIFKTFLKGNKFPDQLVIDVHYGALKYHRAQFFKFSSDWYWYGPVHEVLTKNKEGSTQMQFPFGYHKVHPDGNSWQTDDLSKKYQDHAEILLQYQNDNEWKDARWTFYLAQSYKDAANIRLSTDPKDELGITLVKKAIQYFTERVADKTGFHQEIYYSQLMIARLQYHLSSDDLILNQLLKCEELNADNRVEHLFNIASFLQAQSYHKSALMYLKLGLKYIKEGTTSALFLEPMCYEWALYDMYGVSLYFTGDLDGSLKYFKYTLKKINNGNATNIDIERVENNVKSAENAIQQRNHTPRQKIRI